MGFCAVERCLYKDFLGSVETSDERVHLSRCLTGIFRGKMLLSGGDGHCCREQSFVTCKDEMCVCDVRIANRV